MSSNKYTLLRQVHSFLSYHKLLGIEQYPAADTLTAFLRHTKTPPPLPSLEKQTPLVSSSPAMIQKEHTEAGSTILEVEEEVRNCRSCDLIRNRVLPVPGKGGSNPRLFVVGGWLTQEKEGFEEDGVFGTAEDQMLERMLTAIHLDRNDAFITNVIKCGISQTVQPKAENIHSCFSYLERQIAALSPEILCAMGITAARALLQITQPLSQLRGQLHQYVQGQSTIPLVVTYHPTFLLQNPEMKTATWADLQLIMKYLQGKKKTQS
ncbi:MAG: uracil-DNA glycosylase [Desulfopila sp.]|jgi:DNA polymerase|nr:uracil-DNA glycosylase [Desulfopila sp.]